MKIVTICLATFMLVISAIVNAATEEERLTPESLVMPKSAPFIMRFQEDGAPDLSFNGGKGVFVRINDDNSAVGVSDLYLDFKGRILTLGGDHFTFTRFSTTGKLDLGFNFQGIQRIKPVHAGIWKSFGVSARRTINLTDTILAAGNAVYKNQTDSVFYHPMIVRLTADGQLDHTFGEEGIVDLIRALNLNLNNTIQTVDLIDRLNGNYAVLGNAAETGNRIVLISIDKNGNLDTSFGVNGTLTIANTESLRAVRLLEFADYWYIVAESVSRGPGNTLVLFRINRKTLTLDASLGDNGFLSTSFNTFEVRPTGASLYAKRLAIVGASFQRRSAQGMIPIAVYDLDKGELDTSFSGDGKRIISHPDYYLNATDVVVDYRNRIFVTGSANSIKGGIPSPMFMAKIEADGSFDKFTGIKFYSTFTNQSGATEPKALSYIATRMFLEKSGYILVGGTMSYAP